jgi:plastocyanin
MINFGLKKFAIVLIIIGALLVLGACSKTSTTSTTSTTTTTTTSQTTSTTSPTSTTTTGPAPTVTITAPTGPVIVPGNLTVTIEVTNFNIVDKQGQANVPGEGHIHYYLDVDAPTTPGQPAIPPNGSWAHVASTTYTFTNVAAGQHKISVELVNNDHTPLVPPVVATANVLVMAEIGPPNLVIASPRDGDTLPAGDITVTIGVTNFNIVDKQGQANVSHEGHVHYYLDVDAPTTAGKPAIPASGTWAHVASTTYTFTNVAPGMHNISVELVNNDHTPLDPPVVAKIMINVAAPTTTSSTTTTTTSTTSTPSTTSTTSSTTTTSTGGQPVTINLTAQNIAFNMTTITVPAGASVTINFQNNDSVPHNFSLFTNSSATPPALFQGQVISGGGSTTYKFTAPSQPGTYFFRCDVHPTIMTGSFIVQ